MSSQALIKQSPQALSFGEMQSIGKVFVKSGFFADTRDEAQAIVKIMAGAEMGFSPFASMSGLYIVKGKVSIGANLMAAKIKASGKYDFRLKQGHPTEDECSITFYERRGDKWEEIGVSTFTRKDAQKAGTQNMDKFGRNMLYSRAISNGCKWFCPDVFTTPIYTPEEMGADVDGEGDVPPSTQPQIAHRVETAGEVIDVDAHGEVVHEEPKPVKVESAKPQSAGGREIVALQKTLKIDDQDLLNLINQDCGLDATSLVEAVDGISVEEQKILKDKLRAQLSKGAKS